jgi:hypothetical protein
MTWNDHDHRGEYADERHDHGLDYAEKHHRHYDLERQDERLRDLLREIDGQLGQLRREFEGALGRIRQLEDDRAGMLAELRVLDGLRPTCVICHDATADRQTVQGPACTDCVGDPPDGGPDPDRPETWAFGEAPVQPLRPDEAGVCVCPETSDGQHCGDWHEGGKCGACGQAGPDPDEDQAGEPEPAPYDPGPGIDDEGGMSEYRYVLPEDYQRGQS